MVEPCFPQSKVSTYAGNVSPGYLNGSPVQARFNKPFGLCIDKKGNIYIADQSNHRIRKIDIAKNLVSNFAGNGIAGWKDGSSAIAQFNSPAGVCVDDSGNVYVTDFANQRIRKISPGGMVTTIAGDGAEGYRDGLAQQAQFDYPRGIAVDSSGNVFVADSWNHRIRKISRSGIVSTYAGGGIFRGVSSPGALVDGADTTARFFTPAGLYLAPSGNLYVADAFNHRIRLITPNRKVRSICGNGFSGSGFGSSKDGDSASAYLNTPTELFADESRGYLFISETFANRLRLLNLGNYSVSSIAGSGIAGYKDGQDNQASFNYPRGIARDATGNRIYVCDHNNNVIRLIEPEVITNLNHLTENENISLFPNPAMDRLYLDNIPHSVNSMHIYSLDGVHIHQLPMENKNQQVVLLPAMNTGIYLVVFEGKENSFRRLIFIQP